MNAGAFIGRAAGLVIKPGSPLGSEQMAVFP